MARLNSIDPAAATGKAKALLDAVNTKLGKVPNMMRIMANSTAALESYLAFSGALNHGELLPKLRELIALTVAEQNECEYCVAAHTVIGKGAGISAAEAVAARRGQGPDAKSSAAITFARRIVETNGHVSTEDVRAVRSAGYTDGQIAELIAVVSLNIYTNLFNKVVDSEVDFPKPEPVAATV